MDNLPFRETDLFSFAGLALIIPALVGGLKKLWPKWIDGKEPTVAFVATYVLGFTAKLTAKAVAFPGVSWLGLALGLFFVALAAAQVHDTFLNKVVHKEDPSDGSGSTTATKLLMIAVLVGLLCGGCCPIDKMSVENVGKSQDLINTEFLKYVTDDAYKPKLDAKAKDDWLKLVQKENELRAGLLKK